MLSFVLFIALLANLSYGQKAVVIDAKVEVTYAQYVGKTVPLHEKAHRPLNEISKLERKKRNKPLANFPGRRKSDHTLYPSLHVGEDPVRQRSVKRSSRSNNEPVLNVEGLDRAFVGTRVPDTDGDIGRDFYVQCVNASYYQVFDKQGQKIGNPVDFNSLWIPLGFTSAGDPVILYDHEFDRWIITEFPNGNQLLVAVSETSDPFGSYNVYNFATPRFPDYPKYGLWKNSLYLTTNESGPSVHHAYFLDRSALINGDASIPMQRIEIPGIQNAPGFMAATPVDWSGSPDPHTDAKPMVMYLNDDAWGEASQDQLELYSFDVDFEDENNTVITKQSVPTAAFDTDICSESGLGFQCIPQPNSDGLDGLPWTIMNQSHYRKFDNHESIVLNFSVDYTGTENPIAGIRWIELRRSDPSEDWSVYQEGTFAPQDGLNRFMGCIAQDGLGNIGIAYNVSSESEYAGLRYTGRRVNDPLGTMTLNEYNLATGLSATSDDRFGDYATMSVDPMDERTFWFTGEYMKENNSWGTKVVAFTLVRDSFDLGPLEVLTPNSGPNLSSIEMATVTFKNFGLLPIDSFTIGYQLENEIPEVQLITDLLAPDSSITVQFATPLDLSSPGLHRIKFFTSFIDDSNSNNDTLRTVINNQPFNDASITGLDNFEQFICGNKATLPIMLSNPGIDTIFSVQINLFLNTIFIDSILWTGILASGQTDIISKEITNLVEGLNDVHIVSTSPNNMADEYMANDTFHAVITSASTSKVSRFILRPDRFPEEVTWQIVDDNNVLIYSGGPYGSADTLIEVNWCLAPGCHTFTIFDAADDGICCTFGDGYYQIIDPNGTLAVDSDGQYGDQEETMICIDSCVMEAEFNISPVSIAGADDGVVMISARNGKPPYRFSLNGGMNVQFSNLFSNLSAGEYYLYIQDREGCVYRDTFDVTTCDMQVLISTTDESSVNAQDGSITFDVMGGTTPITFSIDGGNTFQSDSIFSDLVAGEYPIQVRDQLGCQSIDTVTIDLNVAVNNNYFGQFIRIFPNPTDGLFYVEAQGIQQQNLFLPYRIYDVTGSLIQVGKLVQYSGVHKGEITIERQPEGIYYMTFPRSETNKMLKLIKQ